MSREADRQKIKQILTDTIVSLCNTGMSFSKEMTIEGLLGITLDHSDVLLINIHETIGGSKPEMHAPPDMSCRSSENILTLDQHQQPRQMATGHEKRSANQQKHPSESLCSAVQPFYGRQMPGGFDNNSTSSGGSNHVGQHLFERQNTPAADRQLANFGQVNSTSRYVPSTSSSQHIKTEPVTDDYGYDESSGEVNYGSEGYDVKGRVGYHYENGEYTDQAYSDITSGDQVSYDAYGDTMSTDPPYNLNIPPVKRRKVPSAVVRKKSVQIKQSVPSPSDSQAACRSGLSSSAKSSSMRDSSSSGLIERALNLVHEGQLTAGVAIKLFGIPRSTFYKKLSMSNPRQQNQSQQQPYSQGDGEFDDAGGETFGDYLSGSQSDWDTAELNCGTYFVNQ